MANYLVEVVGLYYRAIIEEKSGATVADIVSAAQGQTKIVFEDNGNNVVSAIQYDLPQDFGPTRGGRTRAAGSYRIPEIGSDRFALAWQYYIERPEAGIDLHAYKAAIAANDVLEAQRLRKKVSFQRISYTRSGQGFLDIGNSEQCEDGDVIVWRCVAVLKEPGDTRELLASVLATS